MITVGLSPKFPNQFIVGMEIRMKVVEYVTERIQKLRTNNEFSNIAVIRSNAMKYLPNFFHKGQVSELENTF